MGKMWEFNFLKNLILGNLISYKSKGKKKKEIII